MFSVCFSVMNFSFKSVYSVSISVSRHLVNNNDVKFEKEKISLKPILHGGPKPKSKEEHHDTARSTCHFQGNKSPE